MTLTLVMLSGAVVFFGKWAKGQDNNVSQMLGLALSALFLLLIESGNPKMARAFAWLLFFGAFYLHGDGLIKALRLNGSVGASGSGEAVGK